jgi:hypothetical protein
MMNYAGQISATNGDALSLVLNQGGDANFTFANTALVTATGTGTALGVPTSGGGVVIVSATGSGNLTVTNNGEFRTQNDAIFVSKVLGAGTMTVNNNGALGSTAVPIGGNGITILGTNSAADAVVHNTGTIDAQKSGVNIGVVGTSTVTNTKTITSVTGLGVSSVSGGHGDISNSGEVKGSTGGIFATAVNGGVTVDNTDGEVTTNAGTGIFALTTSSGNTIVNGNASSNVTSTSGPGILAVNTAAGGNVTVDSGTTSAGAGGIFNLPGFGNVGGGVIGAAANGGDAKVTTHGDTTVAAGGLVGVGAISLGGEADVTLGGNIDPPQIGGAAIVIGGTKNANLDAGAHTIEADDVGLLGLNTGTGQVNIKAADSTVTQTNPGLLNAGIAGLGQGAVDIQAGRVTAQGTGVFGLSTNGSSTITANKQIDSNGVFGIASIAGNGTSTVDLKAQTVNNTSSGGLGVFAGSNNGDADVKGTGSTVTSDSIGISSLAINGNTHIDSGRVTSANGSGVIGTAIGGDAIVTTHGEITADNGLYGAAAFSVGGDATVTVNDKIDPPIIGASSFTIGPGTATTNVHALTQATGVGAFAGNIGSGNVVVDVNNGGSIQSDGLGVLATNLGPGNTTVTLNGAVGGLTGAATGDDTVNITNFANNGNINVTGNSAGTLNAGDDGVDIAKFGGSGTINVGLNANATAADDGIDIFRTLSGANTNGANNIGVSIGATSAMTLTASNGNGIEIDTPLADNDINVSVGAGSHVLADNGSAVSIRGFSILDDNSVSISNDGELRGEGSFFAPTITVATDGAVNIENNAGAVIHGATNSPFATVIRSASGDTNLVDNSGTITGNMRLASLNGNQVENNSSNTWNTAGLNLYISGGDNIIDNNAQGTINAVGPITVFGMLGGGTNAVNNAGVFKANGLTTFLGSDFGFNQNFQFNNNGGLLSMQNGVSNYGFVTPADFGFIDYGNGVGDVTVIGFPHTVGANAFNASGNSRYGIDAFLAGPTSSSSDLLIVNGDTTGRTALLVNDLNGGPGAFNPTGILVAHVEGVDANPQEAFYLPNGPLDKGLFSYDLFRVPDTADPVANNDWILASYPDQTFFELPSLITGAQNIWQLASGVWLDRTADLRTMLNGGCVDTGGSLKDSMPAPVCTARVTPGAWAKVLGGSTSRDSDHSFSLLGRSYGFNIDTQQTTYGVVGGYDFGHETQTADGPGAWMFGIMGGYVGSRLDFAHSPTDVDYQTGLVGAYATYISGGFFVDGKFVADLGTYDYTSYAPGLKASQSGNVTSLGGVIDTGYRMNYFGGFIEPGATVSYVNSSLDDLSLFGTSVDFNTGDSLRGRIGVRVGTTIISDNRAFEPFVGLNGWYEFQGDNKISTTSAGYQLTAADDTGGAIGEVTAGLNVFNVTDSGLSGFVKGNFQFGEDDLRSYAGQAGLRASW